MGASVKQEAFITKLVAERVWPVSAEATLATCTTVQEASAVITALLAADKAAVTTEVPVTEVGMYRDAEGTIFKVQRSRESQRLYAKRLVQIGGQRLTEPGEVVHFEFEYAAGAVYKPTADQRLSLEEAKAFGIKYGICCVCGAFLKDAQSVAEGIGPVCSGRL